MVKSSFQWVRVPVFEKLQILLVVNLKKKVIGGQKSS